VSAHQFTGTFWTDGDDDEDQTAIDVITRLNEELRKMKQDKIIDSWTCGLKE
jgi:hypothetical protein